MLKGNRTTAKKLIRHQTRYRAFLHRVKTPEGDIIVPLDRETSGYEFLEEVRYILVNSNRDVTGLIDYIQDVANVVYGCAHDFSKAGTRNYLLTHTTLKQVPMPNSAGRKPIHYHHQKSMPWLHEYLPSYIVHTIHHAGETYTLHSPYADEVNFPKHLGREVYYKQGDPRPRLNIWEHKRED